MVKIKLFSRIYDRMIFWSKHKHAPYYLAGVSFIEASLFPIPPDVMLVSMGLAAPELAWRNAWIATLFSVAGGVFGYAIGYFLMDLISPYLEASSFAGAYHHVVHWFDLWGVWVVILAGITPVPYKIFTIAAGVTQMSLPWFCLASLIGRGLRFFLVSCLFYFAGEKIEQKLRKSIDTVVWTVLGAIMVAFCLIKWVF